MTLSAQKSDAACPLCGSPDSHSIDTAIYSDIWKWLETEWGAQFSPATIESHFQADCIELRSCSGCGLQYWFPSLPGSPAFYAELTSTADGYYSPEKWEFDYVERSLNPDYSVLDVACGSGAFVLSIKDLVREAIGIDTNAPAVELASISGATVHEVSIDEFSQSNQDGFDIVTAFQVIEHLDAIMPFVDSCYQCVKPGGRLILSVPNRERRTHTQLEALDHPPHHITRWSDAQLQTVAALLGAELLDVEQQSMDKRQIINAFRKKELAVMFAENLPGRDILIKALSRLLLTFPFSNLTQSKLLQKRLSLYGHTIVAAIRKPL